MIRPFPPASGIIGIDCGSSFCKGVLMTGGNTAAFACRPTGWNIEETGRRVVEALLRHPAAGGGPGGGAVPVIATGYGREQIRGSRKTLTEISAHARGAEFLLPGVKTVIDIGGQDSKVIALEQGSVLDFQMNDKCAAGSGRFLEIILNRLELESSAMEDLLGLEEAVALTSTCVVFAESEIIGLLARGVSRPAILGGVVSAMARRTAALAGRIPLKEPALLTGGLAESPGICRMLGRALGLALTPVPKGAYAGAIGAALSP
jgi:predicted CoA-substrate-specific enzyme activase